MLKTLTASVLLVLVLVPTLSFSQTTTFPSAVQADALWPGGELGLSLTGSGANTIGMWGGGYPFDHIEFETDRLSYGGPVFGLNDHDTKAAGIIIAAGSNSGAKGVAYEASLKTFNLFFGVKANLENEVNVNGMMIASMSNAYSGYKYDNEIDEISYNDNDQNFLFFQAAGNSGLSGPIYGQGKNILSIGSINIGGDPGSSSVGPAADGRIKPDLVAFGGPALTCTGPDDILDIDHDGYVNAGPATSWSAPVAAGVGALLQEYSPMSASSLKGVLIHSATPMTIDGAPSVTFGWGAVNAKTAADLITLDSSEPDVITDNVLNTDDVFERNIYSNGIDPLKATLTWTDPPTVLPGGDYIGTIPTLVNDLDLVLLKDGVPYEPWILSGTIVTTGENNLDNVEQVYIANPPAGTYTIKIDHDGTLTGGSQLFSLIVTGDSEEPIQTPRSLKIQVLGELQDAFPTGYEKVDEKLEKAIEHLEKSLVEEYWLDDFGPTKDGKKKVFDEEKKTVHELYEIVKKDDIVEFNTEAMGFVNRIIDIDRTIAQLKIDRAIENDGKQKYIDEAFEKMIEAQEKLEKEEYEKAIDKFKDAWDKARKALEEVGLSKWATTESTAINMAVESEVGFTLGNNYPNPFNPTTVISYQVPEPADVTVSIYNLLGERIAVLANGFKDTGNYQVQWNGTDQKGRAVSNGMYLYELRADGLKQVKRMTFIK